MSGFGATECLILRTTGTLVAHQVGPCTAETCGAHGLMTVYHDVEVGGTLDGMQIVVHFQLTVVMLATRDDISNVATLYGIVAIVLHQLVGPVHVFLVVHDG